MLDLPTLGEQISTLRTRAGLTHTELAKRAGVSRATVEALENMRARDAKFGTITKILLALGMELQMHRHASRRPTLEELVQENRDVEGLDKRR
jgi:transcriptional regulator with XRE-family HTH domain